MRPIAMGEEKYNNIDIWYCIGILIQEKKKKKKPTKHEHAV